MTLANWNPIARYAIRLGDDALIHGQRLCEWSSRAPTLEEDLALANVALDFLGRTRLLYAYAGTQGAEDEDTLAFTRSEAAYQNLLLVELPRGDFAFTMLRQYLLDVFEEAFFNALCGSADTQLAAIAAKAVKEIDYHLRRSETWVTRLGQGTEESLQRLQNATDELWGYTGELFAMDALELELAEQGIAVNRSALQDAWQSRVAAHMRAAHLAVPTSPWQVSGGRQGCHTEHFGHLLSEMQYLQRAYPGATW